MGGGGGGGRVCRVEFKNREWVVIRMKRSSHFLLIAVFISALAKMSAHFSLEIYIYFLLKMSFGIFLPFFTPF